MAKIKEFCVPSAKKNAVWKTVVKDAHTLSEFISRNQGKVDKLNAPGRSSKELEDFLESGLLRLGYEHEPKNEYAERALCPDYVKRTGNSGIVLEVERGKILQNNMDMLDFWKAHIHPKCNYLILVVPEVLRHSAKGTAEKPFMKVSRRLNSFFKKDYETQVRGLVIVGY